MLNLLAAILIAMVLLVATTVLHWESLNRLALVARRHSHVPRRWVGLIIVALVFTHVLEIGLYAAGYVFASGLGLGYFASNADEAGDRLGRLQHFYFSAETFSTVGYGDVIPVGELRLIASIEPLNGLMLLAWSASFLFVLVQRASTYRTPPPSPGEV